MSTAPLVEFLTARLAEDEQRFGPAPWLDPVGMTEEWAADAGNRLLADITAKRRVIREHSPFGFEDDGTPDPCSTDRDRLYCSGCGFDGVEEFRCLLVECPTLRALAQPYADHPDFDPAWKL